MFSLSCSVRSEFYSETIMVGFMTVFWTWIYFPFSRLSRMSNKRSFVSCDMNLSSNFSRDALKSTLLFPVRGSVCCITLRKNAHPFLPSSRFMKFWLRWSISLVKLSLPVTPRINCSSFPARLFYTTAKCELCSFICLMIAWFIIVRHV